MSKRTHAYRFALCSLPFIIMAGEGRPERLTAPVGQPIKHELLGCFGYSHFTTDYTVDAGFGPGDTYDALFVNDTLRGMMTYRYYFNGRYTRLDVPFDFIPYDHRSDYVDCSAVIAQGKYKFGVEQDYIQDWFEGRTAGEVGLSAIHHFREHFVRGEFQYSGYLDPGENRALKVAAGIGWLDPVFKFGIAAAVSKHYMWTDDGPGFLRDTGTCAGGTVALEYTPSPYVRYVVALTRMHDVSYGDHWDMEIPLSASFVLREKWWELTPAFTYSTHKGGSRKYSASLTFRDYVQLGSVYVRAGYVKNTWRSSSYTRELPWWVSLQTGGDYLIYNYVQIGAEFVFELGNPLSGGEGDDARRGHILRIYAKVFP